MSTALKIQADALKPKDYKSSIKPIWCPGCGDFAVLNAITKTLAYLKLSKDQLSKLQKHHCPNCGKPKPNKPGQKPGGT